MELPIDLWSNILQKTTSIDICNNLYDALPNNIKIELTNFAALFASVCMISASINKLKNDK